MHRSLASVARLEFNVLMQDTRRAIESLELQQQSVIQAIEVAQQAHKDAGLLSDETAVQLHRLEMKLERLHAALDRVIAESDGREALFITSIEAPVLALPALDAQPSRGSSSVLLSPVNRLAEWSGRFLKAWRKGVRLSWR